TRCAPGRCDRRLGSDALQVRGGEFAALAHHVVADLLALVEGAHAGALDRGNVDEHVLSAVGRLDESEALLVVEKLHGTFSHLWPPVKTPIGAMAARPSRSPQSDFGVVLGCPAGRRQEQAKYRTARIYTTPAHFTSVAEARFRAMTHCFG